MSSRQVRIGLGVLVIAALVVATVVIVTRDSGSPKRSATRPTPVSTAAAVVPPALDTSGRNWPTVMRSISDYLGWLFQHPDEALAGNLLANYATPDCPCRTPIEQTLSDYKSKGQHRLGSGDKVDSVKLTAVVAPTGGTEANAQWVSLYVVIEGEPNSLIGPQGNVVERSPGHGPVGYDVELFLMPDGRWHVKDTHCLGTPGVGREEGCAP